MSNYIKTLILSTIVLVMSNNNSYSHGNYDDFNDYFEYINKNYLGHITSNIKSYNDFYDYLTYITSDSVKISDSSIIKRISEIKNVAQQAFYSNQMSVRSYVKLLCYFTLMSECKRYICGDYAMLHVVKKACDEFLGEEYLVESRGYDQAELQNLYNLIKDFSKFAQTRINKMQAESPNLQKDKGMKSLENITDNKVAELMEVWDNFDNKQKRKK